MQHNLPFIRRVSKRFPLPTILISGILLLTSFAIIFSSHFNTDMTRLIPTHAEKTSLYFSLIEKIGGMDKAYIIFGADTIRDHFQKIEKIADEIRSSRMIQAASWKIPGETKAFLKDVYGRKAPLLLSEKEMQEFINKLSPEGMQRELEKTKQRFMLSGNQEELAMIDPLNFFELFSSHMNIAAGSFGPGAGYFLTPDKKNLIMFLTPTGSPRDIAFSEKFLETMESILAKYRKADFSAEITGSHAIILREAAAMKREILLNTLSPLLCISFIFLLFFRSLKGLLYVMTPVVFAIITTMGMAILLIGSLSEVTGASAGLIVGLGIDLGILLYVRYLINIDIYADPIERMDRSIEATYRSITTGVLTTALIFLPMVLSSFRGIRELGLLTGIGMLVCWLFLFTLASLSIKPSSGRFIEIPTLRDIALYAYRKPLPVIFLSLFTTLTLTLFIPRIEFIGDIKKLGTDNNRPRKVLEKLKETYIREQGVFIRDISMDMESALIKSVEIKDALAKDLEHITAAGDILPPEIRQKKNLASVASVDPQRVMRDFRKIAAEKGFDVSGSRLFTEGLDRMLRNREMITLTDVEPLKEVFERLLINEDDQWTIIVSGTLKKNVPLSALDRYTHTGPAFIREELFSILKRDTAIIGLISLVLVNIILYLDFRKIYHVMLCQAPVAISILCTLGIMGLAGISLNLMNTIVFVLLYGIGTDYSVHLLHQYHADRDIGATFLQTGKAVFVAGLTTIAGFGSIGFSSNKGLATMGQVAAIGITLCIIFSLTLVSSLLRLHEGQYRQ